MILHGDSLNRLRHFPDNFFHAVVTDPPYGLAFMGKKWDYDVPSTDLWREVMRVLKPGGHLLSFGGTRTYHRMVVAIEDAGFEIRDQIQWIYASGFPKSLDVSKAIDKAAGAEREVLGENPATAGRKKITGKFGGTESTYADEAAPRIGHLTAPATDDAKTWQGWGTALKPANEPIVLARKPLEKGLTVAENVLKWGVGALNIDASRIGTDSVEKGRAGRQSMQFSERAFANGKGYWGLNGQDEKQTQQGRWPANVLFSEEAAQLLDEQSGDCKAKRGRDSRGTSIYGSTIRTAGATTPNDSGGASRFFYVAKSSKKDRSSNGVVNNIHPTCKPTKLMEYLCRLVTPPGGVILDPFCGSGTTGVAATKLGYGFIGIERELEYVEIASKRIESEIGF